MATPLSTRVFGATHALLIGFALLAVLRALYVPLYAWWSTPDYLEWGGRVDAHHDAAQLDVGGVGSAVRVEFEPDGTAFVTRSDFTWVDRLLAALPDALLGLIACACLLLLARLLRRIAEGRPFEGTAVRDLRILAAVVFLASVLLPWLTRAVDNRIVGDALDAGHASPHPSPLYFAWVGVAVLLFALAQAFEHGARTERDVAGLV